LHEFVVIEATDGEDYEMHGPHAIGGHSPASKRAGLSDGRPR
jgi:hypothetical protein